MKSRTRRFAPAPDFKFVKATLRNFKFLKVAFTNLTPPNRRPKRTEGLSFYVTRGEVPFTADCAGKVPFGSLGEAGRASAGR